MHFHFQGPGFPNGQVEMKNGCYRSNNPKSSLNKRCEASLNTHGKTTRHQSCIIQKINSSNSIFIIWVDLACSLQTRIKMLLYFLKRSSLLRLGELGRVAFSVQTYIQILNDWVLRINLKHPPASHKLKARSITNSLCLHQPGKVQSQVQRITIRFCYMNS